MAELATAGSVVGLISLSISCCEGLTKYYSDFKSYSDEVNYLITSSDELRILCQNVEHEFQGRIEVREPVIQQTARIIDQFRNDINRLDDALSKCRRAKVSHDFATRLASFRIKAVYPFKKRTLQTLKTIVDDAHANLKSALQILQIQISSSIERKCHENQASFRELSLPLHNINHRVAVLRQQNENQAYQVDSIDRNVLLLRRDISGLNRKSLEDFEMMSATVQNISPKIENAIIARLNQDSVQRERAVVEERRHLSNNTAQIKALDEDIKKVLGFLVSRPSLMRSVCDTHSSLDEAFRPTGLTSERMVDVRDKRKLNRDRCTCEKNSLQERKSTFLTFAMATSRHLGFELDIQSLTHNESCPLHKSRLSANTSSIKFSGNLLARAIRASICINRGAGGISFSQTLETPRLISTESQVFKLVTFGRDDKNDIMNISKFGASLQNRIHELEIMFQSGTASPYDVDRKGRTLLHIAICCSFLEVLFKVHSNRSSGFAMQKLIFRYFKRLAELKIPMNWTDEKNQTALDQLLYACCSPENLASTSFSTEIAQLLDDGAEIHNFAQRVSAPNEKLWSFLASAHHYPGVLEELCFEKLSIIVLKRSEQDLSKALTECPQSINQSNKWGQTALHLAVSWPLGVTILLRNKANVNPLDKRLFTPLNYALKGGFTTTVENLMNAGCNLYGTAKNLFTPGGHLGGTMVTFVHLLAERRCKLRNEIVNVSISKRFDISWARDDRHLDEYAAMAENLLNFYKVKLTQPSTLIPSLRTLYHAKNMSTSIAEYLWQAGFRDIDVPDKHGWTPLTNIRSVSHDERVRLVSWFIEKGADCHRPMCCPHEHSKRRLDIGNTNKGRRAIHYAAAEIGECQVWDSHFLKPHDVDYPKWLQNSPTWSSRETRKCMTTILSQKWQDLCLCACSIAGCRPSTIMLKSWTSPVSEELFRSRESAQSLRSILLYTQGLIISSKFDTICKDWLADEIIRLNTFQALKLRHTCCHYDSCDDGFGFIELDLEEIDEIRDEDSQSIELLEELMLEFQDRWKNQGLVQFLKGYWLARMREVLRARGKVDLDRTRQIGVVWNETNLESCDSEDDEVGVNDSHVKLERDGEPWNLTSVTKPTAVMRPVASTRRNSLP